MASFRHRRSGLRTPQALLESTLLALDVANPVRARHDLRTLAGLLPTGVEHPLEQLGALGDRVAVCFTTVATDDAPDPADLDIGRVLLERHGDELLVASLVAAVGQGMGWDVAVVTSERRAFVAHRACGPPPVLSIADEGRMIDAGDLREGHRPVVVLPARDRRADRRAVGLS